MPADLRAGTIDFQTGDDVDLTGLVFGDGSASSTYPPSLLTIPAPSPSACRNRDR